ncbi:MAG: transposase [Peptostreptococcaceae bacterium]|nr:transposase [Peptostreptococcaceae bacterium]
MGEEGRKNTQNSYIWLRVGVDPLKPAASYRYYPTGTIQTDGYVSNRSVVRDAKGKLRHAGCLVHVRRYIFDVYQATKSKKGNSQSKVNLEAETMLKDIKAIFKVEKKYRSFLKNGKISEEQFVEQRKAEALLLFATFHTHLLEASKTVIPKSTFDVGLSLPCTGESHHLGGPSLQEGPLGSIAPWNVKAKDLAWQDRMPLIPKEDD